MTQIETETLRLERTLNAPIDAVWRAWSDPDVLAKWFSPTPEMDVSVQTMDVKEGGDYEITMHGEEDHVAIGQYKTVDQPHKLVMTWNWKEGEGRMPDDTTLAITLVEVDGGTRITLEHSGFPAREAMEHHEEGWIGCLDRLASVL